MQANYKKIPVDSKLQTKKYKFSILGWILISLFLTELVVRIFYGFSAQRNINSFEWGRLPASDSVILMTSEGFGITRYIADGEIETPYQGGESVVVLGDSHTEALQVMDAQKYPSIAEELLRKDDYLVDIHNLGFSGMSISDYVFLAPLIIKKYDPSIVVVQLNSEDFNEAFNTSKANHFIYKDDRSIALVHNPLYYADSWAAWGRDLINNSSTFVMGYSRFQQIVSNRKTSVRSVAITPPAPVIDGTYLELQALKSAYKDSKLIIIYLPYSPAYLNDKIVFEDETYQKVVNITKTIDGWAVIDPSNEFSQPLITNQFPRGFNNSLPAKGHLNQDGHQIIGSLLAGQIERLLSTRK